MYVKDPNAKGGLATDVAVVIVEDYTDALVGRGVINPEEFLKDAPGVDRRNLEEVFRIAREARGRALTRICAFLFPSIARKVIWRKIYCYLES